MQAPEGAAYYIAGALALLVLVVFVVNVKRGCRSDDACKRGHGRKEPPGTPPGILPLDCTLFEAVYLPWTPVPGSIVRNRYQPHVANFLFRTCWNVTTTNCWKHRFDFDPPREFDTVVRVSTALGKMYAYFLQSSSLRLTIVAFTGTAFADDWALNLLYNQVVPLKLNNVLPDVRVHFGFYSMYVQVQDEIRKLLSCYADCTDQLIITGYSLGGALATICSLDTARMKGVPPDRTTVYTFGGPRVFNPPGAKQLDRLVPDNWRVYNTEDVVAALPPAVAGEKIFVDPFAPGDVIFSHAGRNACWTDSVGTVLANHSAAYERYLFANKDPFKFG